MWCACREMLESDIARLRLTFHPASQCRAEEKSTGVPMQKGLAAALCHMAVSPPQRRTLHVRASYLGSYSTTPLIWELCVSFLSCSQATLACVENVVLVCGCSASSEASITFQHVCLHVFHDWIRLAPPKYTRVALKSAGHM